MKTKRVEVRLGSIEAALLEELATASGKTVSEVVRRLIEGAELPSTTIVPAVNRETYAALARIAASLNQIAAATNSGAGLDPAKWRDQVGQLVGAVRECQGQVLTGGRG